MREVTQNKCSQAAHIAKGLDVIQKTPGASGVEQRPSKELEGRTSATTILTVLTEQVVFKITSGYENEIMMEDTAGTGRGLGH